MRLTYTITTDGEFIIVTYSDGREASLQASHMLKIDVVEDDVFIYQGEGPRLTPLTTEDPYRLEHALCTSPAYASALELAAALRTMATSISGGGGGGGSVDVATIEEAALDPIVDNMGAAGTPTFRIGTEGGQVAFATASTVTVTGSIPSLTSSAQLKYILVVPSSGAGSAIYENGKGGITLSVSGSVVTINGTSPFAAGDSYEIGIVSQKIGLDYSSQQLKADVNTVAELYTTTETLVTAQNLTDSYAAFGSAVDVRGFTYIPVRVIGNHNTSQDVTLKAVEVIGSEEFDIYDAGVLQELVLWEKDTVDTKRVYMLYVAGFAYIKIYAKHATASGTAGDLTIKTNKIWN